MASELKNQVILLVLNLLTKVVDLIVEAVREKIQID